MPHGWRALDRFVAGAVDGIFACRRLAESASRYPPLDEVGAFDVDFDSGR